MINQQAVHTLCLRFCDRVPSLLRDLMLCTNIYISHNYFGHYLLGNYVQILNKSLSFLEKIQQKGTKWQGMSFW